MRYTAPAIVIHLVLGSLGAPPASARTPCASPIDVHEWGVQVFAGDGSPATGITAPPFFHRRHTTPAPLPAVRDLPADNGLRELPVVHFYTRSREIAPIGFEVGFSQGAAAAWFPAVDLWRRADDANSAAARQQRDAQLTATARPALHGVKTPFLDADPTMQLVWDRLTLTPAPTHGIAPATGTWVEAARKVPNASWVNNSKESERFLFYDARTTEPIPFTLTRTTPFDPNAPTYVLANRSLAPVHDIVVTVRDGRNAREILIAGLGVGETRTLSLSATNTKLARANGRATLRRLVEGPETRESNGPTEACVTNRHPGEATRESRDHRLHRAEVDLLLGVWGARFFDAEGVTIVFREDAATLARAMPIAIYTDTRHTVVLNRLGLGVWERIALP